MKIAPHASALILFASCGLAQSSSEDSDKRPLQACFYGVTPLKPGADFATWLLIAVSSILLVVAIAALIGI